jgi:hypothetical protein
MKRFSILASLLVLIGGSILVSYWMFHSYNFFIKETSFNADWLFMFDFLRNILHGQTLSGWNFPHAPGFFPDVISESFVLLLGWSNTLSLLTIAAINYSILIICFYFIIKSARSLEEVSFKGIIFTITLLIMIVAYIFPLSMLTIYFQIFCPATPHLMVAILVLFMLVINKLVFNHIINLWKAIFLFLLTFLTIVSDITALFLLLIWLSSEMFYTIFINTSLRRKADIIIILIASVIASVVNTIVPRQSLEEDFFSKSVFLHSSHLYFHWLFSSYYNVLLICTFIVASLAFPFLLRGEWPNFRRSRWRENSDLSLALPSLGVLIVFPCFFETAASLRYLSFPAIILILCLALIYYRFMLEIKNKQIKHGILIAWCILTTCFLFSIYYKSKVKPEYELNAAKIYRCISNAAQIYPLQDGIATYWNARPVKFYSHFKYYLAQVPGWQPSAGYYFWLSNWYDFLYKNVSLKIPRKYNYILATTNEVTSGLWGNITKKANGTFTQNGYTIFYFKNDKILWDFLFFKGPPLEVSKLQGISRLCIVRSASNSCIFTADHFSTQAGTLKDGIIKANGSSGYLVLGPYVDIGSGKYHLVAKGHLIGSTSVLGNIYIISNSGKIFSRKKIILKKDISDEIISIDFTIDKPTKNILFNIIIPKKTTGYFTGYEITETK